MDWMYLFYFSLAALLFFGAKSMGRGSWNEEYTSLGQTKILQGITVLGVALHHIAQKTCASWVPLPYIDPSHSLNFFLPMGYLFVSVFLFCSGLGLYRSFRSKPDYLKSFFRRRILPVVIAFYLSEFLYTAVRLLMGEKMDPVTILWYLSGLHMANTNAWYAIVIPFFYLAFWAAFRFCRREGTAISMVFLFALGYTVLGACIDHQNSWWMRGEWWYNSIILFPLGLLFAKYEEKVTRVLKKGYIFWLPLSLAGTFLLSWLSEWLVNNRWGYYGEWGDPLKVVHRLLSAGSQWIVCIFFVAFCFLLMMKIRFGNRVLAWLGAVTLDFYLMHGLFVELFGYSFLNITNSLLYIRKVPLYLAAVLGCSVPAAMLFRALRHRISGVRPETADVSGILEKWKTRRRERKKRAEAYGQSRFRRFRGAAITVLLLAGLYFLLTTMNTDPHVRNMNGLEFRAPQAFTLEHGDTYNVVWKCTGEGTKAGYMILDSEILDSNSRSQDTLERMLEECDWLEGRELYVNPQGIRMVRGMVEYSGRPERRYYIESPSGIMVLRMAEDERFYDTGDCEEAMLQMADSVRRPD